LGRTCKLCTSIHRAEYEEMRLKQHLTYREIIQIAKNKYGERFTNRCLSNHFNKHVEEYLKASIKSAKQRSQLIKESLEKNIAAVNLITKSLQELDSQLERVINKPDDPDARKESREIISKIDDILNTALKYSEKLGVEETVTDEEIYDRLLYSIEPLDVDDIQTVKKRWKEYTK